jgi:hypothetical protein
MEEGEWDSLIAIPFYILMFEEVLYKKTQHGSFALFTSGTMLSRMIEINDLCGILDKLPYEIINYFTNLYGTEIIETWGVSLFILQKGKAS